MEKMLFTANHIYLATSKPKRKYAGSGELLSLKVQVQGRLDSLGLQVLTV